MRVPTGILRFNADGKITILAADQEDFEDAKEKVEGSIPETKGSDRIIWQKV